MMGATIIEKHLTLNKRMKGPDHRSSLNPKEFSKMVDQIRMAEMALGNGKKKISVTRKGGEKIIIRKILKDSYGKLFIEFNKNIIIYLK